MWTYVDKMELTPTSAVAFFKKGQMERNTFVEFVDSADFDNQINQLITQWELEDATLPIGE